MPWRRVVIRPDSIIRFWSLNLADVRESLRKFIDDDSIDAIRFDRLVAFSDGSELIRTEEFGSFAQGLIAATTARPNLFSEIGHHYEAVGRRWLGFLERCNREDLKGLPDKALAKRVERFVRYYRDYAPILWVPFIVERRYATEYPTVVAKVADALAVEASGYISKRARILASMGAISATRADDLRDVVRQSLEFSPRRTMTEEKEQALLDLAVSFESNPATLRLFTEAPDAPALQDIATVDPGLHDRLIEAWETHKWISHWGYPSHHRDATPEDILLEVASKVGAGAARLRLEREREVEQAHREYVELMRLAKLAPAERRLIEDINYYNFLRTYRMEIKIRAQYLSIPLFREIERRGVAAGKLAADDIFWMVPPEILTFLSRGDVPKDLPARREAWALPTQVEGQEWKVLTGPEYKRFIDGFFSIIDWRDNARGKHNPTAGFVGGKGVGLYALLEHGVEPPPFFVVTTHAFQCLLESSGLRERLRAHMLKVGEPDVDHESASNALRSLILDTPVPAEVEHAIVEAASTLPGKTYAVRSSATIEDAVDQSWAGRFDSVLHVASHDLLSAVRHVWASLFSTRALQYASERNVDLLAVAMAVVVQEMIAADVAGVMNTTFDRSRPGLIEIEAAYGDGTAVVDGEITPDRYVVDITEGLHVVDEHVARQTRRFGPGGWQDVEEDRAELPKLTSEQLSKLAILGKRLEDELGVPQDIEFCLSGAGLAIVQARPQTGLLLSEPAAAVTTDGVPAGARLVVAGLKGKVAAIHEAKAQVLTDLSEGSSFATGNVLVLQAATPAWDPVIFRASALITNEGGATSHAIRVSNERGIPAVVGTGIATELIESGSPIVIDTKSDAFKGKVFKW